MTSFDTTDPVVADPPSGHIANPLAAAIDAVAVSVFVLIGMANHDSGLDILTILQRLWPFLVGAAVGWSIVYVYSHVKSRDYFVHDFRPSTMASGVVIWVCTIAVGMVLRFLLHQGVAPSFVVVATVTTALFLIGWRALAAAVLRRR